MARARHGDPPALVAFVDGVALLNGVAFVNNVETLNT